MHTEPLVRMANQIGTFFSAMPDREEAMSDIAQHIRKFWEPRMRRALLAHLDAQAAGAPDDGLNPIVAEAVRTHRSELE